jgi:hypothetical protein
VNAMQHVYIRHAVLRATLDAMRAGAHFNQIK